MTTAVQHRRGTTAEHAAFTGLEGELTIDTTKDTAVIHDGTLAGGYPLAKENLANVNTSGLSSIDGASTASDDKFFIYDQSATSLKTITRAELNNAIEQDALANVAITGGTINGTTIGGTTAAAISATTLTTSSTVTHNGGSANGVCFLNNSKVLTTGSALTFDGSTLNVTRPSTEGLVLELDSAGASTRTLEISSFTNSVAGAGWRFNASSSAGVLAFSTNSTEGMRLTSTGLGIGTSSPSTRLDVNGSTYNPLVIRRDGGTDANTGVVFQLATNYWNVGAGTDGNFGIAYNATNLQTSTQFRITSSGNVGIGTSSPAEKLNIVGGDVLIGTDSGSAFNGDAFLKIQGSSNAYIGIKAGTAASAGILFGDTDDSFVGGMQYSNADNALFFNAGNAERLRINSSGNVGIGTSSPSASAILDAQSTTKGVRMPNMTTTQKNAIASPAAGLMVFDTTLAKLCVYTGSAWETITSI